ncbi:DUF2058 domain-containing protein [Arenimonas sp.]|uniref:DUF2058 domain-containing protein n=1 Tax=Arenimonas sp. TaxID=1872635 RepID=UPI0039E2EE0D
MSDSLKNQLLGLGFKALPQAERKPERKHERRPEPSRDRREGKSARDDGRQPKPGGQRHAPSGAKPRTREEMDLGKAYAIRAQKEKEERIEAERLKQEEARVRREARTRLVEFLKDKSLNVAEAEIARHFPYGGKIKRIHVTAEQLAALNVGELGIVQDKGRYMLVTAAVLAEAEAIFPDAVALKVDPNAPAADDQYGDPQYQVPDDLVW